MGFTNSFICFPNFCGLSTCALFVQIIYFCRLIQEYRVIVWIGAPLLDATDLIGVCALLEISFPAVQDDLNVQPKLPQLNTDVLPWSAQHSGH